VPMVNSLLLGYYKSQHLYEGLAGHTSRPSGLAGNWHALGLEFMMALVLGWLALRRQSAERPWVLGAGMFLLLFGIAAVATITSIVLVLAFFGVVLWRALDSLAPGPRASLRGLLVAALLVTSTSLVLYLAAGRSVYLNTLIPASLYVRLYDWLFVYGPIIRSHLLLGYGPSLPEVAARSDDSQFVLFLLRGGVVSLFGWLVATGGILRWCRREGGYNESQVGVARVAFVFTAALVGASLMQSFFTYTGVVEWYWATIGVASARRSLRPGDAVTSAQRSI